MVCGRSISICWFSVLFMQVFPQQRSPLNHILFWIQVHDLLPGFMSENVGRGLGNFIGQFREYDVKNSSGFWRSFMRIRVIVDITQPLKRAKKNKKSRGRG